VYAPAGAAIALFVAFLLAGTLRDAPGHAWLAVPVSVLTVTSTLGWLLLAHQPGPGFARVRAWLTEAPVRPEPLRATTWDFLAARELRLRRYASAADAAREAAALAPHRRVLLTWGIAATMARDHVQARRAYRRLLERAPDDPLAWLGLGGVAAREGDSLAVREALARLGGYAPESAEAREIRRHLMFFPDAWPGTLPVNPGAR
jgi:tetratricopeptide (TPR) repeat protein